jgi:fatty acid synthase, animal type
LNFQDIILASGKLPADVFAYSHLGQVPSFGLEYAGISERGRRVMGMLPTGALATHVEADDTLTWECPKHWSLEQAATIPVVYGTVYTAFFVVGQITKGKSILIHAGSGGIGLAAIRVAFAYGLDVYTTVSSQAKRQFLLSSFKGLKVENIGNSNDTSFEKMIMLRTNGKGVDFVLNSLANDKLQASVRCLSRGGKFLEIGKFDLANDGSMGLGQFLKGISFHAVLLDNIFRGQPDEKETLRLLIDKDIQSGVIKPLNTTLFSANEIEKAFRYLTSNKNMGKVLCQMRDNEKAECTTPITVIPKIYYNSQLSYVICGGCDGLGVELADWLVIRGCRKLIFTSNIGISKNYWNYRTKIWKSHGVEVILSTVNISTKKGCEALLLEAAEMGRIGGVFIASANAILDNQNVGVVTKFLDEAARKLCPTLQHFIVFSNVVQSNKIIFKSTAEKIVEQRHSDGLPAKDVQWQCDAETVDTEILSFFNELDPLLTSQEPIVRALVVAKPSNRDMKGNIFDSIMNILAFPNEKPVDMNKTLSELGMDSIMICEIKQTLERELESNLTTTNLYSLTLNELQELVSAKKNNSSEDKLKLASKESSVTVAMLLKNLNDEGEMGEQTLVRLDSANNHEQYSSCVLLMPGLDLASSVWYKIASSLSIPTFFLQLPSALDKILEYTIEIFKQTEFFYLVGYSFGAIKTLELARKLEATGIDGHVMLIDGAPKFLKKFANNQIGEDCTDECIQLNLFAEIIRLILPEDNPKVIMKTMTACSTWPARIEKIVELSKDKGLFSETYIRQNVSQLFNQIKGSLNIDLDDVVPIKSPITLIRPTEVCVVDIDEDYGLGKYTVGEFNLKIIEGNHMTMLRNPKLSELINEMDPFVESNRRFKSSLRYMPLFR